jgi:hypothetical protein
MKSEAGPPTCQLRKGTASANTVYSRAERVFILEHYFALKSFVAAREAFSKDYPDKEAPNETRIRRMVTKFREKGNVCLRGGGGHLL